MPRTNDRSIGDAIREFLHAYNLEEKVNEQRLMKSWETVAGKLVSKHTKNLFIRNRVLFVQIDSSALRNELLYSREKIMGDLNKEVGSTVIEDIVFK